MPVTIDKLYRTRRKSLSLEIGKEGELIVRAPLRLSEDVIHHFIYEKSDWIRKKQEIIRSRARFTREFVDDEFFLYLGRKYQLQHLSANSEISISDKIYMPALGQEKEKYLLIRWYKSRSAIIFGERVRYFADLMQLYPSSVKISNAQKRWGSCSGRNNINLSWRLIMSPMEILDYVIVHELAHIKHKNHSTTFWGLVGKYCPEYKKHRKWLRENGYRLTV